MIQNTQKCPKTLKNVQKCSKNVQTSKCSKCSKNLNLGSSTVQLRPRPRCSRGRSCRRSTRRAQNRESRSGLASLCPHLRWNSSGRPAHRDFRQDTFPIADCQPRGKGRKKKESAVPSCAVCQCWLRCSASDDCDDCDRGLLAPG